LRYEIAYEVSAYPTSEIVSAALEGEHQPSSGLFSILSGIAYSIGRGFDETQCANAGLAAYSRNREVNYQKKDAPKDCALMGVAPRLTTTKDFELNTIMAAFVTLADPETVARNKSRLFQ